MSKSCRPTLSVGSFWKALSLQPMIPGDGRFQAILRNGAFSHKHFFLYSSSPKTLCVHLLIIIVLWSVMSLIAPAGLTVSHWVGMATRKAGAQTRQTPPTVPQPKQQLRLVYPNQGLKKRQNFCRTFTTSRQLSEQLGDWKFIVDQIGKNTTSKVTVSTLLQRIIYLGLNLSGITSITAAVA